MAEYKKEDEAEPKSLANPFVDQGYTSAMSPCKGGSFGALDEAGALPLSGGSTTSFMTSRELNINEVLTVENKMKCPSELIPAAGATDTCELRFFGAVGRTAGIVSKPIFSLANRRIYIQGAPPDSPQWIDVGAQETSYSSDAPGAVILKAPRVMEKSVTFRLPATDGAAGTGLITDGQGNLSFGSGYWEKLGDDVWYKPGNVYVANELYLRKKTAGSVLFINAGGQLAEDNANLFYDSSSARLGLGTNGPTRTLDVVADDGINLLANEADPASYAYTYLGGMQGIIEIRDTPNEISGYVDVNPSWLWLQEWQALTPATSQGASVLLQPNPAVGSGVILDLQGWGGGVRIRSDDTDGTTNKVTLLLNLDGTSTWVPTVSGKTTSPKIGLLSSSYDSGLFAGGSTVGSELLLRNTNTSISGQADLVASALDQADADAYVWLHIDRVDSGTPISGVRINAADVSIDAPTINLDGLVDHDAESATAAGAESAYSLVFNHNKTTIAGGDTLYGLDVTVQTPAGNDVNTDDTLYGCQFTARHYGDGTITGIYGGRFQAYNYASSAATDIVGINGQSISQNGDAYSVQGLNFGATLENYWGEAISSDYLTGACVSLALNAAGAGSAVTVGDIRGFVAEPIFSADDSGTVTATNYYGFLSKNLVAGAGTISLTNQYGLYIEEPTHGTNKWAIYAAGGLTHLGGDLEVGQYGRFGVDDTTRGLVYAYGPATGGAYGGTFLAYTGADHDATISNYGFMVKEDDLLIGPDTNVDALKLDALDDLYITGGSLILPASEYVNFGGALGSGGYGLRDNAGAVEYCDSGGAWTALNAGGGGSGDSMIKAVAQAGHGLSVGNLVKCSGANTYAKAQADSAANAEVVGIVASSADGDNFVLLMGGYWASASVPAQAAGTVMYLSPTSAGAMTTTEPTTDGQISKPVGVIVENGAKMLVFNWRGVELSTLQVTGADLGDSFGVTATKLKNTIITSFANRAYASQSLSDCWTAGTMFTALINSAGTGGLTATNVPYDGDANEGNLVPYPALTLDGRLVLHNTTRGTSRLVTAIDTANNFITTVSTADAWADNDALTMESQACTAGAARFCDLDLSGMIPATATAAYIEVVVNDSGAAAGVVRVHPYEAYGTGKYQTIYGPGAGVGISNHIWVPVSSQRICLSWDATGVGTLTFLIRVFGWQENADT